MKNIADYETAHFSYDPLTGFITHTRLGRTYTEANHSAGYIVIGLLHKTTNKQSSMKAHRLAWYLHYGTEPALIDHQDGNRINNKISNLISTTTKGNMQNLKRYKNATYLPCVKKTHGGKFEAQTSSIRTGTQLYFGTYHTELDAHYTATYYKQVHYALYNGNDLTDINGLPHPYFTGQLATIMQSINDTSGNPALNYMHK